MTVRMLQSWNGLYQQQIVSTLSGAEEARLIALGFATADLDGPDVSGELARFAYNDDGSVAGLAGPDGVTLGVKYKKKIAVGILGQSNERGQVLTSDLAAYPQAFQSIKKPSLKYPLSGTVTNQGSWWYRFFDSLWDHGYDVEFVNQARGSASFVKHMAGQCAYRNNSATYFKERDAIAGSGDRGAFGQLIVMSGKLFQATTGLSTYLQNSGNKRIPTTNQTFVDYVVNAGTGTTAAADPATWAAATLGSTVVDGTVTWTCIDATNSVGYSSGQIFNQGNAGYGFDPFGMLTELHEKMQKIQDAEDKYIILCNAQSDTAATSAWYQASLTAMADFFLTRGYKVVIGLSCYAASGANTAAYDMLTTGLNSALTAYAANANVKAGANLYALMGSTGVMGAGGAYLQADNIHLNGAGALVAGDKWADAFKSFLPQLA